MKKMRHAGNPPLDFEGKGTMRSMVEGLLCRGTRLHQGASRRGPPPPQKRGRSEEQGFSLVELMVVIVIIGLLATIVIINVMPAADRAAVTKARADIATLEQGIDMYRLDHMRYPTSDEGLQALVDGDYIRRLPDDPWGHPYRYRAPGSDGRPFQISSLGADGREGGSGEDEDISN
jgi:general secretion pathway protein G